MQIKRCYILDLSLPIRIIPVQLPNNIWQPSISMGKRSTFYQCVPRPARECLPDIHKSNTSLRSDHDFV